MANLTRLLEERQGIIDRGQERSSGGNEFFFSHTNVTGVQSYSACCFAWTSPGTGVAIIELWGASGSGALMCCCSGGGIPGNPGAYSKIEVDVTPSSAVCGFVGCSPTGGSLCYPGRSQCSVACLINTSCNNILVSQGGFGGYTNCSTVTAHYCCLVAAGFSHTLTNTFCGILCNVGGPNGAVSAPASGGDINIPGGISCLRTYECVNCFECNYELTIAVSPGIFSSTCATCFRFVRSSWPYEGWARFGSYAYGVSVASMQGMYPTTDRIECWTSGSNICGCYEWSGCVLGGVGFPGTTGQPCVNVRSSGQKGGHGGVRITFYT
jgi:hypothetical protein